MMEIFRTKLLNVFQDINPMHTIVYLFVVGVGCLISYTIWMIYFHPLSNFPGPKLAIISNVSVIHRSKIRILNDLDILFESDRQWQIC